MEHIRTDRIISYEILHDNVTTLQIPYEGMYSHLRFFHEYSQIDIDKRFPYNFMFMKDDIIYLKSVCIYKYMENGKLIEFESSHKFDITPSIIERLLKEQEFVCIEEKIFDMDKLNLQKMPGTFYKYLSTN